MILVINKIDCVPSDCMEWAEKYINSFSKHVLTSAITGQGIQGLETAILDIVGLNKSSVGSRRWTVNQVSYLYISVCVLFFYFHNCIVISCLLRFEGRKYIHFGSD